MTPADFLAARLSLRLTQRALAEALGYHWNFIARVERGEEPCSPKLATALRLLVSVRAAKATE